MMKITPIKMAFAVVLFAVCTVSARPFTAEEITETLKLLRTYDYGADPAPANTLEDMIRFAIDKPVLRAVMEEQMIALLESDATFPAKQYVCHQLWVIGTDTSLAVLEPMLLKKDTAEIACFALRTHPSERSGRILRDALGRVDDETKVRIINILGGRQDAAAIDQMILLLKAGNAAVAEAAAISLGETGTDKAAAAIAAARSAASGPMRSILTRAWLRCAEQFTQNKRTQDALDVYNRLFIPSEPLFVRRSALVGALNTGDPKAIALLEAALYQETPMLRAAAIANSHLVDDPQVTSTLITALQTTDADTQALIIEALMRRDDPAVRGAVTTAARSPHGKVRIAAFDALAALGDASSAALLCAALPKAATAAESDTILAALRRMEGRNVGGLIANQLMHADDPVVKVHLIAVLSDRRYHPAAAMLIRHGRDNNADVAKAALKALAVLAGISDLPALIDMMTKSADETVRDEAVRTMTAIAQAGDTTAAVELVAKRLDASTSIPAQIGLVKVLSALPSATSIERLRVAVNSPDPQVSDAGIRALAQYPDVAAAGPLLEIFKTATDPAYRVLALRGLVRLCKTADVPAAGAVGYYTSALTAAATPAEKILILSGLAQTPHPDAFRQAVPLLADEATKTEAALALLTIAETTPGLNRGAVEPVLRTIVADATLQLLAPRAAKLLDAAKRN